MTKGVKMTHVPSLYLLDISPADFFLFPRVKLELAGLLLSQESFKKIWVGSSGLLPGTNLSLPFGGGWNAAKSASRSTATM